LLQLVRLHNILGVVKLALDRIHIKIISGELALNGILCSIRIKAVQCFHVCVCSVYSSLIPS